MDSDQTQGSQARSWSKLSDILNAILIKVIYILKIYAIDEETMENTQHVKGYKLAVFIIDFLRSHPHLTADSHFNKEKRTCRLPEVMRFEKV